MVVNHCYLFYVHHLHSVTCCLFIHPTLHLSTSSPSLLLNLPLLKLKSISKLCPFHVPLQPSILSKWSLSSKHEVNLFVFCHDKYFMDCLSGFSYIIWDSLDSNFCTFIFFFHQKFIWRHLMFLTTWTRTKLCPGSFYSYVTFLDLCNGHSIIHLLTITQVMSLKWIHASISYFTFTFIPFLFFHIFPPLSCLFLFFEPLSLFTKSWFLSYFFPSFLMISHFL